MQYCIQLQIGSHSPAMSESTAGPSSRFERRRRRNREALLEAAIELFQERGVRGTKLEDICERADVAQRTFFNHFETREHLYRAIAQQRTRQAAAFFDALSGPHGSLRESLPRLFADIASYLDARPAYRELVGEMLHVRTDDGSELTRSSPLGRAALRYVERELAAGARPAVAPGTLADLLLGALTLAISNWSASEAYDLPRELERSAAALVLLFSAAGAIDAPR